MSGGGRATVRGEVFTSGSALSFICLGFISPHSKWNHDGGCVCVRETGRCNLCASVCEFVSLTACHKQRKREGESEGERGREIVHRPALEMA